MCAWRSSQSAHNRRRWRQPWPRPFVPEPLPELPTLDLPDTATLASTLPELPPFEALPSVEDLAPMPVPEVESVELDLADLQEVFEGAGAHLPEATLNLAQLAEEAPLSPPQELLQPEPLLREADLPLPFAESTESSPPPQTPAPDIDLASPMLATGAVAVAAFFASETPAADVAPEPQPEPEPEPEPEAEAIAGDSDDEQVKVIGPLRISIPLFNIYLNEADELSRRLGTELAEWALEHERHPVPESSVALAHSLAGNSATVGYSDLSALARALEHALMRSHTAGHGRPAKRSSSTTRRKKSGACCTSLLPVSCGRWMPN
jgi:chemosensory pili system protein ChpA (sensor histidine kinase/response regulator)